MPLIKNLHRYNPKSEFLMTHSEIREFLVDTTGASLESVNKWRYRKRQYYPQPPTTKAAADQFVRLFVRPRKGKKNGQV